LTASAGSARRPVVTVAKAARPAIVKVLAVLTVPMVIAAGCGDDGGDPNRLAARDLAVGVCFDEPIVAAEIDAVDTVACTAPHIYEVYAVFDLPLGPDAPFPGDSPVGAAAFQGCVDLYEAFVGSEYDGQTSTIGVYPLAPSERSWPEGDRVVTCSAYLRNGDPATGTLAG
jgi:Septum formation